MSRVNVFAITNDVLPDVDRHYVTIWMRAVAEETEVTIHDSNEILEAGWYPLSTLPGPQHRFFENLLAGRTLPPVAPGLTALLTDPGGA